MTEQSPPRHIDQGYDFWQRYYEDRGEWLRAPDLFERWGRKGLSLVDANMERLIQMCEQEAIQVHIAVYPWPENIRRHELDSIQVGHWKEFAEQRNIGFLNLFSFSTNYDPC